MVSLVPPYLLLFHQNGSDLGGHHAHNGGDVIFEPIRKTAPSGDALLLQLGDVLSHALHLKLKQSTYGSRNTHEYWECPGKSTLRIMGA